MPAYEQLLKNRRAENAEWHRQWRADDRAFRLSQWRPGTNNRDSAQTADLGNALRDRFPWMFSRTRPKHIGINRVHYPGRGIASWVTP